jgi:ABC-type spermidine/putrescine transport system permease subunit II
MKWTVRTVAFIGFAIMIAPLIAVIVNAFNANALLSNWGGFTTHWFTDAINDSGVRSAAGQSVEIAALVTALSAVMGTLAVSFSAYAPRWLSRFTESLTIVRVMVPEVIMAAGLVLLMPKLGFTFGLWTVVLGQTVWAVAFFIAILGARRAGFDRRLEDAGRDLGATPWRVLRTIVLPDLLPGIIAGALLTFTFSFDDVVTTVFLSGPSTMTLPTTILARIRRGITPEINAVGVLVMLVTIILLALATVVSGQLVPGQEETKL